ncbi:MAG: penicillin-binding transpeptidase domain-containing protein [Planctomycetota bacterium]|jgi:cell division protein FtsI/penicillin-binding protein 2|nr:penicillin-binding transpeptidase domain-containing protein [Planctomycetota bacterium]MDP6941126.1 penicillin-binding transpeptidase domain-containing protein [Planctomycetota bacterium]
MRHARLLRLAIVFLSVLFLLIARLWQMQVVQHEDWLSEARSSRSHVRRLPYSRGRIVDAEGEVLARDRRSFQLSFEYRSFRRSHPAGQLFEVLGLLGGAEGGLDWCWENAENIGESLLDLHPSQLLGLNSGMRGDLLFYLRRLCQLEGPDVGEQLQEWAQEGELSFSAAFPQARKGFTRNIQETRFSWRTLEDKLPNLMQELESERRRLEWWVRQRGLREAAGRGFGLTAWQVYRELTGELEDSEELLAKLRARWSLAEEKPVGLELGLLLTRGPALQKNERQVQFDSMGALLRKVEEEMPEDLQGARRKIVRDVHGNRIVRLRRDLEYELVDLLARHPSQYPGLFPIEESVRALDSDVAPHLVGRMRAPSREEVSRYEELRADYRRLARTLDRTAVEEASFIALRDQLRSTALRPDERTGASGIESFCSETLGGERGYLEYLEVGEETSDDLAFRPARNGKQVQLSLNARLFLAAEEAVRVGYRIARHELRQKGGKKESLLLLEEETAGFALMDLRDGGIPVLCTSPSYSTEDFQVRYASLAADRNRAPLRHRALAGGANGNQIPYPGSTFKLLAAVEALEQDSSWWDRELMCERVFFIPGSTSVLHCEGYHGPTKMNRAIRQSCNIYFYRLGLELGYPALWKRAKELGFGKPTGLELTGKETKDGSWELSGLNAQLELGANSMLHPSKAKGKVPAMHFAIGQAHITASPLQMARFYGWLANGKLWRPHLLKNIGGQTINPEWASVPLSEENRLRLRTALSEVVNHSAGTAWHEDYSLSEWGVVGKTGTAQVGVRGGSPLPKHAWFTGYFPEENPRWSFAIFCEGADLHGGEIATRILHSFLSEVGEELLQ